MGGPATCAVLTGAGDGAEDSPGVRDTSQISSSATSAAANTQGQRGRQRRRRCSGFRSSSGRSSRAASRSEEHTSELQSLMRISYAVFCLKKKTNKKNIKS